METYTWGECMFPPPPPPESISGSRCHLCGSKLVEHNTYRTLDKKGWVTEEVRTYSCGTLVRERVGKKKNFVDVGDDCLNL